MKTLVRIDRLTNAELEQLAKEQERAGNELHADELRRFALLPPEQRTRIVEAAQKRIERKGENPK